MGLTPFEILVIGHLIADWLFQTKRQAYGKLDNSDIRREHCLIYTIIVYMIYLIFIQDCFFEFLWKNTLFSFILLYYLYYTHFLFDTPKVKLWWCRVIKKDDNPPKWLLIGIDQIFHLISLIPLVYIGEWLK